MVIIKHGGVGGWGNRFPLIQIRKYETQKEKEKIIHAPLKLNQINIRNPRVTNTFTRRQEQNTKKREGGRVGTKGIQNQTSSNNVTGSGYVCIHTGRDLSTVILPNGIHTQLVH